MTRSAPPLLALTLPLALALSACAHPPHDSVPGHLDPHHHVRLQNGYVRVLETRLAPGEETGAHSHPIDAAVVFLTDGTFEITADDGTVRTSRAERHAVFYGNSAIVHRTRNAGDAPARTLAVEIFSRPPARDDADTDPTPGETLIDNETVRVSRVRLEPGASTRPGATSPTVLVALTPVVLRTGGGAAPRSLGVGDVLWAEPDDEAVAVDGPEPLDAILVRLKPRPPRR